MTVLTAIPAADHTEIMNRLDRVKQDHGAKILLAIESGSRAWGFPSPDSDYDVRFLYVLPPRAYLGLVPPRDVIEQPIEGLFDINGWDLRKALNLLLKANPVLCEWTRSPIVYIEDSAFRMGMERLIELIDERPAAKHQHLSILRSTYLAEISGREAISQKRYLYCLRSAYALHWMWANDRGLLPMTLSALRSGVTEPNDRAEVINELLERKAVTREIGNGPRIKLLDAFLEATIKRAESERFHRAPPVTEDVRSRCEEFLFEMMDA